jgi:hypothetical protein
MRWRCVVIFLALSLWPLPVLARGGPLSLYGAFDPRRDPHPVHAGTPTPFISPSEFLGGCGRGRYRDPAAHTCRGPADVGSQPPP